MAPYDPRTRAPFLPMLPTAFDLPGKAGNGLPFDSDRPLSPGTRLAGRFEVISCLDEGRCGFLYRVRDRQDGDRERVLKTLDPRRSDARDEEWFRREMRLLQRLSHPRIPKGLGIVAHADLLCALQSEVKGIDLHAHVMREGPLSEAEGREVLRQGLAILEHLHTRTPRILHRDVKPDNLIRDPEGGIWLIDFGAASDLPDRPREGNCRDLTALQTLGFAAPEQALGLQSFPASDCFALAASTLFLVTGRNPVCFFDGTHGRYMIDAPLSEGVISLLERMLAIPAGARFSSAREALDCLEGLPAAR